MTSIAELFPKCRKLAYDARQQLAQVQNGVLSAQDLCLTTEELDRQLDLMEQLAVHREMPQQRLVWKRKIQELREDSRTVQRQAEQHDRLVHHSVRQARERDELLLRRRRRQQTRPDGEQDLNNLAEEAKSLQQSHLMVDDLLHTGEASLKGLVQQRSQLRGIRGMISDMSNRLGLSNATMRIIERRDVTDAYLVFAGMVVTCIVIYFCYFHFEKR